MHILQTIFPSYDIKYNRTPYRRDFNSFQKEGTDQKQQLKNLERPSKTRTRLTIQKN